MVLTRPFVVYMEDAPRRGGSGAHLRFFSNLRALSDVGATIHLVRFVPADAPAWAGDDEIRIATDVCVVRTAASPNRSIVARLAYRNAVPMRAATRMYFPDSALVESTINEMNARHPDAMHIMEGESLAAAAVHTNVKWLWSEHERLSASIAQLQSVRSAEEQRVQQRAMARERAFVGALEQRIVRRARGSMLISAASAEWLAREPRSGPGVYLPTSIYEDDEPWSVRSRAENEVLSLLHLGSISHLPSFTSLQFLLAEVFPHLGQAALDKFTLTAVGRADETHPRTREILALASRYPNVRLGGFAADLKSVYASHHAQIVASTQGAGIRTRVVESLARGMPLVATDRSFEGIVGAQRGRDYAHLPDDGHEAARAITELVNVPGALEHLRNAGRTLYDRNMGRSVVARALGDFLATLPD